MKEISVHVFSKTACVHNISEYRPVPFNSENYYSAKFPSIIMSNGTVWTPASIYLNHLLIEENKSQSLLESIASDLVDFLRFLDTNQLNILHFPPEREKRVTYRFQRNLLQRIRQGLIATSTARQRMNRILRFYDFLLTEEVFSISELKNRPYEQMRRYISCVSASGDVYNIQVESSNLRIRSSTRPFYGDEILDGGRLHPLEVKEKEIFLNYLDKHAPRDFQLICYMALYTGARIQTICTFRISHIKKLIETAIRSPIDNTLIIRVGGKSLIDSKGGYEQDLFIPAALVKDINNYIQSAEWKKRSSLSYYRNSEDNYVFLTRHGNPYYTSHKEIEDRNSRTLKSDKKFNVHRGHAVRQILAKIYKLMMDNKEEIREFSIHDLRATFGLDLLRSISNHIDDLNDIIPFIQKRMGHRNINSTIHYLKYVALSKSQETLDEKLQDILYRFKQHG